MAGASQGAEGRCGPEAREGCGGGWAEHISGRQDSGGRRARPLQEAKARGRGEAITRELVEVHRHVTHAEYYARVADLYHSHKDAAGYENVQLKLES